MPDPSKRQKANEQKRRVYEKLEALRRQLGNMAGRGYITAATFADASEAIDEVLGLISKDEGGTNDVDTDS